MKKPTPVQKFHFSRIILMSFMVLALFVAQSHSNKNILHLTYNKDKEVLAYATGMSISDLLTATNQSRTSNSLPPLRLDAKLNSSAQAKANDMVTNNYWSHVSPTGVQPWYWFQQSGYVYLTAGENLAYGFNTGNEVNQAWMNSPTHHDNIVGDYADVGFGIANGANFQGGEYTIVVAHYGKTQQIVASAPTVPANTPVPTPSTKTPPPTQPTTLPATTDSTPTTPENPSPDIQPTQKSEAPTSVATESGSPVTPHFAGNLSAGKNVTIFEQLKSGILAPEVIISIAILLLVAVGYAVTHRKFVKHLVRNGQKFVLHHPLIDLMGLGIIISLLMSTSVGRLL